MDRQARCCRTVVSRSFHRASSAPRATIELGTKSGATTAVLEKIESEPRGVGLLVLAVVAVLRPEDDESGALVVGNIRAALGCDHNPCEIGVRSLAATPNRRTTSALTFSSGSSRARSAASRLSEGWVSYQYRSPSRNR